VAAEKKYLAYQREKSEEENRLAMAANAEENWKWCLENLAG